MGFRFRRWPGFRCASSSTFFTICRPLAQSSHRQYLIVGVKFTLLPAMEWGVGGGDWEGQGVALYGPSPQPTIPCRK